MRRLKRVGVLFYFGCLSGYDVFFNGSQTLLQRVKQCCIASTHFIASYTVTHFVGVKCCAASETVLRCIRCNFVAIPWQINEVLGKVLIYASLHSC